jgi:cob(I)alamin adenosyltransferase
MHKMSAAETKKLEDEMDRMQQELKSLNSFTLPGGGVLNAFLHQARTVCRRAERVCWALRRVEPINDHLMVYINRLSDHLFVQSRWVAKRLKEPEFLWDRGLRIDPRAAVIAKRRAAAAEGAESGRDKDAPRSGKR